MVLATCRFLPALPAHRLTDEWLAWRAFPAFRALAKLPVVA
jgi:hypothetical protein